MITHKLSSITDTQHIAVLSEGQVVETGSRKELLNAGGLFSSMFHSGN
jgi:ABC-type multidrug transport system fused ATPase/permease subunit